MARIAAQRSPSTVEPPRASPRLWRELTLVAIFYGAYTLARLLVPHDVPAAYAHAEQVLGLEHRLGIDAELDLNHALLHSALLARLANLFYATAHFAVTITVLVWMYRHRPEHFRRLRTALMIATGAALIGFWVYPLAPPRFLGARGFVDPVTAFHSFGLYSSPQAGSLTNQFAAMPSMHAGWAVWCAIAVISTCRRPIVRAVAGLYPIVTLLVIFTTANHYLLDAIAGITITVSALCAVGLVHRQEKPPRAPEDYEVTNKTTLINGPERSI